MDFHQRMQGKSSAEKAQIAFVASGVITGLIAIVWMSTLPARVANTVALDSKDTDITNEVETRGLGSILADTKAQLGNLINATNEEKENEPVEVSGALSEIEPAGTPREGINMGTGGAFTSESPATTTATTTVATSTTPEPVVEPPVDSATTTEPAPAAPPRVILIGTTTSQKSE